MSIKFHLTILNEAKLTRFSSNSLCQTATVGNTVKLECPLATTSFVIPPSIEFYKYKSSDTEDEGAPYLCDSAAERDLLQRNNSKVGCDFTY